MTEHFGVSLRGIEQSQQQLDGRRFARAVRAEQAEHLAWPDLEIHVIHRPGFGPAPEVFEYFRQPANDDDVFRRRRVAGCGLGSFLFKSNRCFHPRTLTPIWVLIAPPAPPPLCPPAAPKRPGTAPVLRRCARAGRYCTRR